MKFCSQCGGALEQAVPQGDDRPRAVCTACGRIAYQNPRVVVGCIVEHEQKVLLCRRAIEPAIGRWTPPAGFLEMHEGVAAGARRETREEAQAEVEVVAPHAFIDVPDIGQTYALFRARLRDGRYGAGPESLETALFSTDELPWDELAFPVMHFALRFWVEDREAGRCQLHHGVLHWNGEGSNFDWRCYELRDRIVLPLAVD